MVTVWTGLELLLVKSATESLTIEPRSYEDIQADLRVDAETASVSVTGITHEYQLILQAKSRATGPWSSNDIARILAPRAPSPSHEGPAPRPSPLEMLVRNVHQRYLFVTNEGLQASLYRYRAEHLFDWPEAETLPPFTSQYVTESDESAIAARLAFCPGVTLEILQARTRNILTAHGHVPLAEHNSCIRDLKEEVRERMLGRSGGQWTRAELVSILTRHHGSVLATRVMDYYVRPRSFDAIRQALADRHAVVIVGPSGTGKSLTADVLEGMLRHSATPFSVIGEERGPGHVRAQLVRPDPILFHLRDPWGGNQLMPDADRWTNELPKLLEYRNANRKFLVTSRSDVLHSAGSHLDEELEPYIVRLEVEDYGLARLREIYDRRCGDLSAQLAATARAYRERVLERLQRPFELDRFFVALAREEPVGESWVEKLIIDSQIEAISRVVTQQVLGRPRGSECAAFIWGLLATRGSVAQELVPRLRRQMRRGDAGLQLEVEDFVNFLIAGRNLRLDGTVLTFYHPRVEDGLRAAMEGQPATTETVLSRLCDALSSSVGEWGTDTALQILRAAVLLENIQIELTATTGNRLNELLLSNLLRADPHYLEYAFNELAVFGTSISVPACLAAALINNVDKSFWGAPEVVWKVPALSEAQRQVLRADARTPDLTRRFVSRVLPTTRGRYQRDFLELLADLNPNLREAYWAALRVAVLDPDGGSNIDTIVRGACGSDPAHLDAAIEVCVQAAAENDQVRQRLLREAWPQARELELHQWELDQLSAQLSDRTDRPTEGLKAITRLRREKEGVEWIGTHPYRSKLVPALATILKDSDEPTPSELQVLFQAADSGQREAAWSVAEVHWNASLEGLYVAELLRTDLTDASTRQALIRVGRSRYPGFESDAWIWELGRVAVSATTVRRLELIHDMASTPLAIHEDTNAESAAALDRAHILAGTYDEVPRELAQVLLDTIHQRSSHGTASAPTENSKRQLEMLLPDMPDHLASIFVGAAAAIGIGVLPTLRRLLGTDSPEYGVVAVKILTSLESSIERNALIDIAVRHDRYAVRREVLTFLASRSDPGDRPVVLRMAQDKSAAVRLAVAEQMSDLRWPEAIDCLADLLSDTRDFSTSNDYAPHSFQSNYKVARAAAGALAQYEVLPEPAVTVLIGCIRDNECDDPMLSCNALTALARCNDPRMTDLLLDSLEQGAPEGMPSFRMLAETAAWMLLERTEAGSISVPSEAYPRLARLAGTDSSDIAAPVLLTLYRLNTALALRLVSELQQAGKPERAELLLVTAALNGHLTDESSDLAIRLIWKLCCPQPTPLTDDELHRLRKWRSDLSAKGDVAEVTARMLASLLSSFESRGDVQSSLPDDDR